MTISREQAAAARDKLIESFIFPHPTLLAIGLSRSDDDDYMIEVDVRNRDIILPAKIDGVAVHVKIIGQPKAL